MTNDALTKFDANVPEFLRGKKDDNRGTGHFRQEDIQIPRLSIAQALSPEQLDDDPKQIEGLKLGEMFNSLTKENYHQGPIEFFVLKAAPPRGVEFIPREQGGGVKDRDVPLTDPRMQWRGDKQPIATLFYDYVILMSITKEIVALSMKGTNIKVAKNFNGLIAMRKQAIFAGKYSISCVKEKNNKGTYGVFQVDNAGWCSEDEYPELEKLFDQFAIKEIVIHSEEEEAELPLEKDGMPLKEDGSPAF